MNLRPEEGSIKMQYYHTVLNSIYVLYAGAELEDLPGIDKKRQGVVKKGKEQL